MSAFKTCAAVAIAAAIFVSGCSESPEDFTRLREAPSLDKFCQAAQKMSARTPARLELVVHEDFDAFVKSKAIIDGPNGPQIQQYNWTDDTGNVKAVSCKLKTAEHLNLAIGEGTAGGEGTCQEFNRELFRLASAWVNPLKYTKVVFDEKETVENPDQPGMTGPDWLAPYEMTYLDEEGALHIRAKGFIVEFTDPRFERAPARFRGVHYCHYIDPGYLRSILQGDVLPVTVVGRDVDRSGPPPSGS